MPERQLNCTDPAVGRRRKLNMRDGGVHHAQRSPNQMTGQILMDCRNARIARFGDGLESEATASPFIHSFIRPLALWPQPCSNLSIPYAHLQRELCVCVSSECIHFLVPPPRGKTLHSSPLFTLNRRTSSRRCHRRPLGGYSLHDRGEENKRHALSYGLPCCLSLPAALTAASLPCSCRST